VLDQDPAIIFTRPNSPSTGLIELEGSKPRSAARIDGAEIHLAEHVVANPTIDAEFSAPCR
jgi:hypothetical protein